MKNMCKSCKYFNQCGDFSRTEKCDGYITELQTVEEIESQIALVRSALDILKTQRTENSNKSSELYADYRALVRTDKEAEKEALKSALDAVHKSGDRIDRQIERENAILSVLCNNRKIVLVNDALSVIIEEFNKFNGKPYGEKTRRKISDAIYEKCGFRAYIDTPNYLSIRDSMTIYKGYDVKETLYTPYDEATAACPQLLIANKINADAVRQLASQYFTIRDYVVSPTDYVSELAERRSAIDTAEKAINDATDRYNDLAFTEARIYTQVRIGK